MTALLTLALLALAVVAALRLGDNENCGCHWSGVAAERVHADKLAEALRAAHEALFELREAYCSGMAASPPPEADRARADSAMKRAEAALAAHAERRRDG